MKMRPIQLLIGRFPFNPKFRKCRLVPTRIFGTSFEGDPLWPVWSLQSEFSTFSRNFPVGRIDETCSIYCRTGNSGNFDKTGKRPLSKLLSPVPLFCILLTGTITLYRVCATGMYRSNGHVEFPKFQTTFFLIASAHSHDAVLLQSYCWFLHDVTKIQTKKLSILPRFFFTMH